MFSLELKKKKRKDRRKKVSLTPDLRSQNEFSIPPEEEVLWNSLQVSC